MGKKFGADKTSRGYCGWYITWYGKKSYLRSKQEYVMARFLDKHRILYKTENHVYHMNDMSYKPDFFLYNKKGNLIRIIEVKYTKDEKNNYIKQYKSFFNMMGISYFVFYKKEIDDIVRKYREIGNDVIDWCNKSANIIHDMKGKKNPHYGMKHSDDSKIKIGQKTVERFKNIEFKRKHRLAVKKSMTDDVKKHISEIRTGVPTKKVTSKQIITKCVFCGSPIEGVLWYNKKNIIVSKKTKNFCSVSCSCKYTKSKEIKIKKEKQIELMLKYKKLHSKYLNRKMFKMYCQENGIPCDIRATFGTHSQFINYMEENYG